MEPVLPVQKTASLAEYEEPVTVTTEDVGKDTWSSKAPRTALSVLQAVPRAPVVARIPVPPVRLQCI